jgi:hypothetical protein
MPMDESPVSHEDTKASDTVDRDGGGMNDIWSSIGAGRPTNEIEGPPTIRPIDDPGRAETKNRIPMTSPTPNPASTGISATTPTTTSDAIRDELRIGVRMLEALELQLKRAEDLIATQSEVTRRAELASERLETTLAKTNAPAITETTATPSGDPSNSNNRSRPVDPRVSGTPSSDGVTTTAATATIELRQILGHASTMRRDFHGDLSAVTKATAALVEAVEIAAGTERTLRNAIGEAERSTPTGTAPGIGAAAESIGEVLRRLAREFDVAAEASVAAPTTPVTPATPTPFDATPPSSIGSIDPHERRRVGTLEITRPLEFDVTEPKERTTPTPGPAVH